MSEVEKMKRKKYFFQVLSRKSFGGRGGAVGREGEKIKGRKRKIWDSEKAMTPEEKVAATAAAQALVAFSENTKNLGRSRGSRGRQHADCSCFQESKVTLHTFFQFQSER